jgi:hypothetical protein
MAAALGVDRDLTLMDLITWVPGPEITQAGVSGTRYIYIYIYRCMQFGF